MDPSPRPAPPSSDGQQADLAAGLHLAAVDEDIVVLDARTDAYSCLPGAASAIRIDGGRVTATGEVIAQLTASGIAVERGERGSRRIPPALPTRALLLPVADRVGLSDAIRFWAAWWRVGRGFARRSLPELLAAPGDRVGSTGLGEAELARLTAAFVRWLPWAPGQGACLYRACLLRTLIRRAGGDVQWVFGVRTWPFSAHCWLQVGDAVLDDEPDRVRAYTPIMAA